MGRSVEDRQVSIAAAYIGALFQLTRVDDFYRDALPRPGDDGEISRADQNRIAALAHHVRFLGVIPEGGYLLLRQGANKVYPELRVKIKKSKRRLPRTRPRRIVHCEFSLPIGIQQIFVRLELLGIDKLGVDKNR